MEDERELRLAKSFAEILDGRARGEDTPELAPELAALAEIDRALDPEALPERLSGHKIVAGIGSGGMGRVLLAIDEALGRKVAIKTLAPRYAGNPVLHARFMAEARAMARLAHPNIVRIYNLGPAEEPPHFVMEFLEGAPLTKAAARLTFEQKAELMHKVVLAVEFLHQGGMLHRDLKPANILVGADLEPKLLDFGLALDLGPHERLSRIGEMAGTPEYFSPEQAGGAEKLDARSDVFSLGAVLYELLTGAPPFRGETVAELLRRIREDEPALPRRQEPQIPKGLQDICLKALEKDPAQRYGSAREMADDLRRYLAGEAVLAEPAAYARLIAGKVGDHLRDLESWRRDQVLSDSEYEGIRKRYERLLEREDAWIMEARRLTLPQVSLYLGAWILAVGAALLTFFRYRALAGAPAAMVAWAAAVPMAWIGIRTWKRGYHRVAIAYLLAFAVVLPVSMLVTMEEAGLFDWLTRGSANLELFHRLGVDKQATNAQLWWALAAGLPVCWWLRRFTRAPVFSLMFSSMGALLCLATLLRMGLLDWVDNDPGRVLLPPDPVRGVVHGRRVRPGTARPARRLALFLSLRGRLHLGGAERCGHLPRTLCEMVASYRAVDARANRVPVHRQRGNLFRSRPHLRPAFVGAGTHGWPRLPLRDPRACDDVAVAVGHLRQFAHRAARLRVAAAGGGVRVRVLEHSAPDEKLPGLGPAVLRHRSVPAAAKRIPGSRRMADPVARVRPRPDGGGGELRPVEGGLGTNAEARGPLS